MKPIVERSWQRLRDATISTAGRIRQARLRAAVKYLQNGVADLVFPPQCVSCDAELSDDLRYGEALICSECVEQFTIVDDPMCELCGAPLPFAMPDGKAPSTRPTPRRKGRATGCYYCRGRKIQFDATVAFGLYGGLLKDVLLQMKQSEGDALSLAIGRLIWQVRGERLAALGVDVVAPVPLHWRRRIAHRTNSAGMLAEVLSSKLRVPRADRMLRRNRATHRQFDLTPPQRWDNVREAFAVRAGHHLKDAHVLLVDDILTTGATCSDAARALKSAGAARVTVVVAARVLG
jgi:predicted amidophosphoribosyltransferase